MARGDVFSVDVGNCPDLYGVDTGMYETPNYGAVYVLDADRPAVIDTGIGTNYDSLRSALDDLSIDPAFVIPTHVHLDHAGGTGFLARDFPAATVVCHERGARHLVDPDRLWAGTKEAVGEQFEFYTKPRPVATERIREVTDGDVIDLGDRSLVVHHAPGHAPHHCFIEWPDANAVFTADAAGIYVPAMETVEPTTPPPNFDFEACLDDVANIKALDPTVLLFAHYGPYAGTEPLSMYRDVLRNWVDDIRVAADTREMESAVIEQFVEAALDRDDLVDLWGERKVRAETAMNVRGVLGYLKRPNG